MRALLEPFCVGGELPPLELNEQQRQQLAAHLDLLVRWNAKTNLTAVRDPNETVTRHFGESLFLVRILQSIDDLVSGGELRAADLGSGAGFPGLPLKVAMPRLAMTLIESQNKKATFLREVVRACTLTNIDVYSGRAEELVASGGAAFDLVTMRAVDDPERAVQVAMQLLRPGARLALLIGERPGGLLSRSVEWRDPVPVPGSLLRSVRIGHKR